ncbi:MAG: putative transcriptional regulator [Ilumatobacteraceae bacterium]|nr:putative transcriptional regulator [Ilumatobacteraceae bacterium]
MLDRAPSETSRLEIVGEPGIGKSALFDEAVALAVDRGFRVLVARPNEFEASLAYAGLGDLIGEITEVDELSPPEQRALDVALARADADGVVVSTRTLGAAVAATLRWATGQGPTLLAIDDIQWLDVATADVLSYVLRRLPPHNLTVLVARRPTGASWLDPDDEMRVEPMSDAATRQLAVRLAGPQLPRATVDRVVEASGGNPLFVKELLRSTSLAAQQAMVPLPVPASLQQIVAARVIGLPDATVEALALASLLAAPTVDTLAALGVLDDLPPAERIEIVDVVGRSIRFRHPMLASAAHDAIPGSQRLRLHRRLAEVTTGLQRCIHLAFGTDHQDSAVATELSDAVPGLIARGAATEAADLALLALSITPDDDPVRFERMLVCGDALFRDGRTEDALSHLDRARREAPSTHVVARALLGLATIEYSHIDNAERAAEHALRAVELTEDPALLAEAHTILARVQYTDFGAAADHAATALALMEGLDDVDDLALAMALNASATADFMAGRGLDRSLFAKAIDLERDSAVSLADSAFGALAALLKYADELDESRTMLQGLVDDADEGSLPYALSHLPQLELWTGRWSAAEHAARRHLELARATNQESQVQAALFNLAVVAAFTGDIDDARPLAQSLYDEGVSTGALWTERNGAALLGFIAMSVGDASAAVRFLGRYDDIGEAMGLHEPGYLRFLADYIEALVAVGDTERAIAVLDRIEPRAHRLERPSALGMVHRGRALVAAHRGDVDEAIAAARAGVAAYDGTALVYDRARALLTLGVVLRRFKLRAEARAVLEPALQLFVEMGARSLVERVEVEIARLGVRSVSSAALTETEARVAQLAAAGRTTRQIADALFISAKTVEANMTRIYRKLGAANRAELANLLATSEAS